MAACTVVNRYCKAPPALAYSRTRAVCYGCGLSVCTNPDCSTVRPWYNYGRHRICFNCAYEHARHNDARNDLEPLPARRKNAA